jgi:tetratricopeptide (TPR) repeat protein
MFNWYPIEGTYAFNNPETPKDELVQLVRSREKKLADHFGYSVAPFPEDLLNMLGYMNLEWGKLDKSLAFFKLNIEYYPNSPNTYDSIADYYASQKDYQKALSFVTKAYEIEKNDYYKNRIEKFKNKK